jgi:hypothetical protein
MCVCVSLMFLPPSFLPAVLVTSCGVQGGQFYPTIHLLQPKMGANSGPQSGRPVSLKLNPSPERSMAVRHAEVRVMRVTSDDE